MKKSILFLVCALLGGGSAISSAVTDVNAQSVTQQGEYAQVSQDVAPVYDQNGAKTNVAVPKDSTWQVAKTQSINGGDYFQVAPNQYLSKKDSFEYKKRQMIIKVQSIDGKNDAVRIYDHNLVQRTDVSLASGSKWVTDTAINTSNGMPFVRVAPDQYVAMFDVVEQTFNANI